MFHEEELKEAIEKFDNSSIDCKAILYVCLEGGAKGRRFRTGMRTNDFAIMTVHDDYLCFYVLSKFTFEFLITRRIVLPYSSITTLKAGAFLKNTKILRIRFTQDKKNRRLKVVISTNSKESETQRENFKILMDCLKAKIPEKMTGSQTAAQ